MNCSPAPAAIVPPPVRRVPATPTKNDLWTEYVVAKADYFRGEVDMPVVRAAYAAWRAAV